jgi:hypothetical protein
MNGFTPIDIKTVKYNYANVIKDSFKLNKAKGDALINNFFKTTNFGMKISIIMALMPELKTPIDELIAQ